jgi:hypothetical protein
MPTRGAEFLTPCPCEAVGVVRKVNGAPACQLADHLMVDYAFNELMRPVYDVARGTLATASLRPDLQEVRDAGLISHSGRVYLRYYVRKRQQAASAMDRFTAERWVNDVHIESSLSVSDASWRVDVLVQALLFAGGVMAGFAVLARHTAQAVIGLQSALGTAGPGIDYPVGSVHLCQLVRPEDDARLKIGALCQPVLVMTSDQA